MADYDMTVTVNGTTYNFMLLQEGNKKAWTVEDTSLLPPTIFISEPSIANMSPEREVMIGQEDWRGGIHDVNYEDEHKYHGDSINLDARYKGEVMLSPKRETTLTADADAIRRIYDAGMEEWDDANTLTYWTKTGSGTLDRSEDEQAGTYAARLTVGGAPTELEIYQDVVSFTNGDRGRTFTMKAYCKADTGIDIARIGIDDGVDVTWTDVTPNGGYNQYTVVRTLDASATRIRLRIYAKGQIYQPDLYLYADTVTLTYDAAYGTYSKMVQFEDTLCVAAGNSLLLSTDGDAWASIHEFPEDITDLCIFSSENPLVERLYIAQGWSAAYYYTDDLYTFTLSTLSDNTAKFISVVDDDLWISDTANTVRSSANPINGGTAFSTAYTLPNSSYDITGLLDHVDTVYIRKQDQVYYLSGSDVFALDKTLATEAATDIDHKLYAWRNYLFIPAGYNSFYKYDESDGSIDNIHPVRYAPNLDDFTEEVTFVCGDTEYLYIVISAGTEDKILAGHYETIDGSTSWVWHPIHDIEKVSGHYSCGIISTINNTKRLYLAPSPSSLGISRLVVPEAYSAPYNESGYEFHVVGGLTTPWLRTNFPTLDKFWKTAEVVSKCPTDGNCNILVRYKKKGDTSWTNLGYCTQSALVAGEYPEDTKDTWDIEVTSERIQLNFHMTTDDDDYTPILYGSGGGYNVRAKLQPLHKQRITATVRVAPEIRNRADDIIDDTMAAQLADLRTIYEATTPLTVVGPDETSYTCTLDKEGYIEQLAYDETLKKENYWVTLIMLEV